MNAPCLSYRLPTLPKRACPFSTSWCSINGLAQFGVWPVITDPGAGGIAAVAAFPGWRWTQPTWSVGRRPWCGCARPCRQGRRCLRPDPPAPIRVCADPWREEATQFYGRESEVADLLQRLRLRPFVAIICASGAEVITEFAGLLPALQRSTLFGAGGWLVRTFRPGAEPLAAMQTALGGVELELFTPAPLLATEEAACVCAADHRRI